MRTPGVPSVGNRQTLAVVGGGLLNAASALLAGRVFDRPIVILVALAVVPSTLITVFDAFGAWGRRILHALIVLVAASVATAVAGGRVPERTFEGVWRGWSLAVSTDWPSPLRPELVAFVTTVVAVASALTAELAVTRRFRATTLAPALGAAVLFLALSAPAGAPPAWGITIWLVLAGLVLALGDAGWPRPSVKDEFWGERRAAASLVVLSVVAGFVGSSAAAEDRNDPRSGGSNTITSTDEVNPLAQVAADRALAEPRPRFSVEGPITGRWRVRVLDEYDGIAWTSGVTVRPVSRDRIAPVASEAELTSQVITIEEIPFEWLPVSGRPRSVDRFVNSDIDRSVLAPDRPLLAGERVTLVGGPAPTRGDVPDDATSPRQLDEEAAPFATLATNLAGDATTLPDRLDRLAVALRTEHRVAPDAPVGSNVALLLRALEPAAVATPEQFVSAFVLMARSLGATARIAVGYDVPESGSVVTTAEAMAWPEVFFEDLGWVAFDPVPEVASDASEATGRAPAVAGAELAPPPPANPPAQEEPLTDDPVTPAPSRSALTATIIAAAAVAVGLIGLFAVLAGVVVVLKVRRRRRRLSVTAPDRLVLGAWAEATDHLVELGAELSPQQTNSEMVRAGTRLLAPQAEGPLSDLATLANAAAHGRQRPDPIVAAHAVRLLGQVEQIMGEGEGRWARWRRRLSTRSLRRATRSPAR